MMGSFDVANPRDLRQSVCGICKLPLVTTHKTQKYHVGACQAEAKRRKEAKRVSHGKKGR
jgi:hypothetical protein